MQLHVAHMAPGNRLDTLVWIRERREQTALAQLAGAEQRLEAACAEVGRLSTAAGLDARAAGDATLWDLDDAAHRRALQALKIAERQVSAAASRRDALRQAWTVAHQDTDVALRLAERKRAELRADVERRDSRDADELAVLRYARQR